MNFNELNYPTLGTTILIVRFSFCWLKPTHLLEQPAPVTNFSKKNMWMSQKMTRSKAKARHIFPSYRHVTCWLCCNTCRIHKKTPCITWKIHWVLRKPWSGWWLNQPSWKKNIWVKLDHFPRDPGEKKLCLKPPPSPSFCASFFGEAE